MIQGNQSRLAQLRLCCLLWLVLTGLAGCASYLEQASQRLRDQGPEPVYALVGANLIPISSKGVLKEQSLIIRQGKIHALGPSSQIQIPPGARVLDLHGKFILPGFTDMHVHLADERDLLMFLKYGVTTVRNMAANPWWSNWLGSADALALRQKVKNGTLPGPDIFACGPMLEGEPPQNLLARVIHTPQEAEAAVRETAAAGFDCIKVYNHLARPNFDAVVRIAHQVGLPVMGHVPYEVGLAGALQAKMRTIEHLNAYIDNFASAYRFPERAYPELARQTRAAGVYKCPTLVVWDQHPPYREAEIDKMALDPRYAYLSPGLRFFWRLSIPGLYELTYADKEHYPAHQLALSSHVVKVLAQQGAPLLIGTDANLTGVYPGSSTLREMELFARAGVPNQMILQAATLNAARALGRDQQTGSLEVGKRADLVVLDGNPLRDIAQIHHIHAVVNQGHWLPSADLDRMLDAAYGVSKTPAASP